MQVPGGGDYQDFLMPGMFAMTMAFGFINTATVVVYDSTKGVIDRFRSAPSEGPLLSRDPLEATSSEPRIPRGAGSLRRAAFSQRRWPVRQGLFQRSPGGYTEHERPVDTRCTRISRPVRPRRRRFEESR